MSDNLESSIKFKLQAAHYHYDRAQLCLYNPEHFKTPEEQLFAITCEIIAMMLSLQSSVELTIKFSKLSADGELEKQAEELFVSSEYIRDFCNITKHQNIIKAEHEHSLYCGSGVFASPTTVNTCYFIIEGFEYKHHKIQRTHNKRIITPLFFEDFKVAITERVTKIINTKIP